MADRLQSNNDYLAVVRSLAYSGWWVHTSYAKEDGNLIRIADTRDYRCRSH